MLPALVFRGAAGGPGASATVNRTMIVNAQCLCSGLRPPVGLVDVGRPRALSCLQAHPEVVEPSQSAVKALLTVVLVVAGAV